MAPQFRFASNYYRDFTKFCPRLQEKESVGNAPPAGAGSFTARAPLAPPGGRGLRSTLAGPLACTSSLGARASAACRVFRSCTPSLLNSADVVIALRFKIAFLRYLFSSGFALRAKILFLIKE